MNAGMDDFFLKDKIKNVICMSVSDVFMLKHTKIPDGNQLMVLATV